MNQRSYELNRSRSFFVEIEEHLGRKAFSRVFGDKISEIDQAVDENLKNKNGNAGLWLEILETIPVNRRDLFTCAMTLPGVYFEDWTTSEAFNARLRKATERVDKSRAALESSPKRAKGRRKGQTFKYGYKCSLCDEQGHNKRGCPNHKNPKL